jgi:hypothetical protein
VLLVPSHLDVLVDAEVRGDHGRVVADAPADVPSLIRWPKSRTTMSSHTDHDEVHVVLHEQHRRCPIRTPGAARGARSSAVSIVAEAAARLVEEQDLGFHRDRAGDRQQTALAVRTGPRPAGRGRPRAELLDGADDGPGSGGVASATRGSRTYERRRAGPTQRARLSSTVASSKSSNDWKDRADPRAARGASPTQP